MEDAGQQLVLGQKFDVANYMLSVFARQSPGVWPVSSVTEELV
jgi:hypothetical protein